MYIPSHRQYYSKPCGPYSNPLRCFIFDLLIRLLTEGLALLKMQSFRCFQITQGVRSAREASPFLIVAGVFVLASAHQSNKEGSVEDGAQVMRAQASTSCPGERAFDDEVVHGLHRLIAQSIAWIVLQPASCKAISHPAPVHTSEPAEEFHSWWRPRFPHELPFSASHRALEGGEVCWFRGVVAILCPSPRYLVRLVIKRDLLEHPPNLQVLADLMDPNHAGASATVVLRRRLLGMQA
jgi:hypothetical protein